MSNFNEILKDLLIEHDLNAKQLAKKINLQDSIIYKYLDGSLPRVKNAVMLANFFNCSLNYLMGIDDDKNLIKFKTSFNSNLFYGRYDLLLKREKISNCYLSSKLGFDPSNLRAWRKGTVPYLDVLEKIARYFSCSIDYLIGRSDNL